MLLLVGLVVLFALVIIAVYAPGLVVRPVKSLVRSIKRAAGRPVLTPEQEEAKGEAKAKAKKLAPYMAFATKIEQIVPGQTLRFKIARERWGADFVTVELNPQYPQSGKKYILSGENAVQGMPGGKKTIMSDYDNPIEIAASIMDRDGKLLVVAGETPVSAEKVAVAAKKTPGSSGKVGTGV